MTDAEWAVEAAENESIFCPSQAFVPRRICFWLRCAGKNDFKKPHDAHREEHVRSAVPVVFLKDLVATSETSAKTLSCCEVIQ